MATAVAEPTAQTLTIPAPNLRVLEVKITGESPYMQHRFSKKGVIQAKQEQGSTAKSKKKHDARDFEADYQAAFHRSVDGWTGIPASAFRNALISACRVVGFQMTKAKLSVFCLSDGQDADNGEGLVRISGEPEKTIMYVRNETGVVDLRARPMWRQWSALVRLRYDADQFTATDMMNLLMRAGAQVGVGEGRPDSKKSAGMGYGLFTVEQG
jgi:hypothetical protein